MKWDFNWFQHGAIPPNAMTGFYSLKLVALSYIIAVLASFIALEFVGRLRAEPTANGKLYWLLGGAFAMGAGIWSMHFIGMLAFIMPMPMGYELGWTISSLVVAILVSGFTFYLLRAEIRPLSSMILGGIMMGFGIATMHYMGMEGMRNFVNIAYIPSIFILSIIIAIVAAEAALWLALKSNKGTAKRQLYLKIISAIVMGIAICGMHYTGMAAAVFTPIANVQMPAETINPTLLAFFIAGITGLIISLAFTISTSYKQVNLAIQNEKDFLNAMLDNLEDGIIACDSRSKITVFNNALQTNLNLKDKNHPDEILDHVELYTGNNATPLSKEEFPLFSALEGERIHGLECKIGYKNEIPRDVVIDGQPIINAEGKKLGAVLAVHDVTELKQNERLKNEFVSVVSHELRTPLTSIKGALGLILASKEEFTEKTAKLLTIANQNCERLLLLINDILDMEKIQAGKMTFDLQPTNLSQLVNDSVMANKTYGEKYQVKILINDISPNITVNVDPHRLLQVLANLISNAVKFSPEGGNVIITITKNGEMVRTSVIDKGHGIPTEFQSHIFQKFTQADASNTRGKGGTGLGLCISKSIIEKLGGTLAFESKINQGSTFYFDLPIYKAASKPLDDNTNIQQGTKKPQSNLLKRILICENDANQAKYLQALLESAGLESDICYTISEAKELLAQHIYKAILLDLIFPDQDGITFIRELRSTPEFASLHIIVLSVLAKAGQQMLSGDALSVIDWLEKPINFSKLQNVLGQVRTKKNNGVPRILHIEDNKDTQHIIETLLTEDHIKVTCASTIHDAKHLLNTESFDLVILDLLLPDGSGVTLLPFIAKYNIPVIVYSGYELDREYSKFVKQLFIKSKNSNEELLAKIEEILKVSHKDHEEL